jgi:hypothetical protein
MHNQWVGESLNQILVSNPFETTPVPSRKPHSHAFHPK